MPQFMNFIVDFRQVYTNNIILGTNDTFLSTNVFFVQIFFETFISSKSFFSLLL